MHNTFARPSMATFGGGGGVIEKGGGGRVEVDEGRGGWRWMKKGKRWMTKRLEVKE